MSISIASRIYVGALTLLFVAGCPGGDGTGDVLCSQNVDCPGTQLCISGHCGDPTNVLCNVDQDCPTDFICLENGRCRANAQCQEDADCCAGGDASCGDSCVDFTCIGNECTAGDTTDCFVGCHRGERACVNGHFALCNAAEVTPGVDACGDDVDNDCNGTTDDGCPVCGQGDSRACDTPCGPGTQACQTDGTYGACDTTDGCICNPQIDTVRTVGCEQCGFKDSSCGADGFWADDDVCQGQGQCAPGEVESIDCGACGVQTRTCSDTCVFGDFGDCAVPVDACTPGDTVQQGCGTCGSQTLTCDDTCQLGAPSTCDENAGCTQGEVQTQACGKCGEKTSTCDGSCQFGAFGACQNEGVCTPGEIDTQPCGNCGTQTRVCGSGCTFGAFGGCQAQGECAPGAEVTEGCGPTSTQGICEQGSRSKTCDDNCRFEPASDCDGAVFPGGEICGNGIDEDCDGGDDTLADQFELNNDCASAFLVTNPDGSEPDNVVSQPTFDSLDDDQDDYFFINGIDNSFSIGEHVTATLTGIPSNEDLDLYLYKGFSNCQADASLTSAGSRLSQSENVNNADEIVDFGETTGTSDDGQYFVRVHRFDGQSCFQPYTLTVTGLR